MPIPKPEAIPEGIISDVHSLMNVTSTMSSVDSTFFSEHAPELASNRPRATAAERAEAAESVRGSTDDTDEGRAAAAMIRAIRRRGYERTQWLLERGLIGGEALTWVRQFE